jgi:pimeloyl-ACP methyl ester carboxylesterase
VRRELPFYFASYGERERAYVDSLDEVPNGDALRLFNQVVLPSFDLRPELALIDAETLVLTGSDDFITGPVCAEEIADGIAAARTVMIPDAGHFVFVEAPQRFRDEVAGFLGEPG